MNYWEKYWTSKKDSGHRFKSEAFYEKAAREKLFHIDGGDSLLDFGCGAGELLVHYAERYRYIIGVDFSESMLEKAQQRIDAAKLDERVTLMQGNDRTVWQQIQGRFDRISASGVVQYLEKEQLDSFIENALEFLNQKGKIALFEIVDPRLVPLFFAGLFNPDRRITLMKGALVFLVHLSKGIRRTFQGLPFSYMGYSYHPSYIRDLALKYGLRTEYVCSMIYEYRYHVILTRDV